MAFPLALTLGDPAGIGPELTCRAWLDRAQSSIPAFYAIGSRHLFEELITRLAWSCPIIPIDHPQEALEAFEKGLPVFPLERPSEPLIVGQANPAYAEVTLASIQTAVKHVQQGLAAALVTNPINKAALYNVGFSYPGHTEYLHALAQLPAAHPTVMMLACEQLRVVPVTLHVSLQEAITSLTSELIVYTAQQTAHSLQQLYQIDTPRLAISGLNPHAGEQGQMGHEDDAIIRPAVEILRGRGIDVQGPLPADTMFHPQARACYDAALCMTHDQALIPIKTIAFDDAVNITLGLPFVRTSPDHGTAYGIAGQGVARPHSLIAAIKCAAHLSKLI